MSVHDWTKVEAGIFHAFHTSWTGEVQSALNAGVLPEGYYALAEQHAGRYIADVLTLFTGSEATEASSTSPAGGRGTAVAEAPPRVRRQETVEGSLLARRRSLAIRHVSGHRLIALVEILSPGNKDRIEHLDDFAAKAVAALDHGVHLLLVDLFPSGPFDPDGIHGVVRRRLEGSEEPYDLPTAEPFTLAAYAAGTNVEIYLEHLAVGSPLPDMPVFLSSDRYVNAPLETTYQAAYRGMPEFWRHVLES